MIKVDVPINGAVFVLTGNFQRGNDWVAREIEALGGRVDAKVSDETHYLVLSYWDSDEWDQAELSKARRLVGCESAAMISVIREDGLTAMIAELGDGFL